MKLLEPTSNLVISEYQVFDYSISSVAGNKYSFYWKVFPIGTVELRGRTIGLSKKKNFSKLTSFMDESFIAFLFQIRENNLFLCQRSLVILLVSTVSSHYWDISTVLSDWIVVIKFVPSPLLKTPKWPKHFLRELLMIQCKFLHFICLTLTLFKRFKNKKKDCLFKFYYWPCHQTLNKRS